MFHFWFDSSLSSDLPTLETTHCHNGHWMVCTNLHRNCRRLHVCVLWQVGPLHSWCGRHVLKRRIRSGWPMTSHGWRSLQFLILNNSISLMCYFNLENLSLKKPHSFPAAAWIRIVPISGNPRSKCLRSSAGHWKMGKKWKTDCCFPDAENYPSPKAGEISHSMYVALV